MRPRTLSLVAATLALLALGTVAAPAPVVAQAPTTLSYQGRVLDDAGQVVAGPVDVVFSLWSDATGGTELWSESWPGVALSNGVFSVLLGSNGTPLDPADFQDDTTLYLQLEIDGEVLLPRQALGSAPFALVDEPGNEVQDLELAGNLLGLSGSAATVDLSPYLDDTDNDTDAQDLSLVGDTLSLTNDPTPVDLAPYRDNTDAQELTLDGGVLSLTDGGSVDLSGSRKRVLFVTSAQYTGDLGGLAGADAKCQDRAAAAGLGGRFLAWLSDDTGSPSTRLSRLGSFVRVDGAQVAEDWSDLTDGVLAAAIEVTENGTTVGSGADAWVWSATTAAGGLDSPVHTCDRWSSGSGTLEGQIGVATASDNEWTLWSSFECDVPQRLYCVQEPGLVGPDDQVLSLDGDTLQLSSDDGPDLVDLSKYSQALTVSGSVLTLSGSGSIDLAGREERRVFITSTTYDGALGGLAGADAKCQARAAAAGWAGTFLAWLSDASGSPSTRFDQRGSFVRPDGVVVADDWTDLTDGTLDAPINVDELGGVVGGAFDDAWTATDTDGTYRAAGPRDCASWTSANSSILGWHGEPTLATSGWTSSGSNGGCGSADHLYCFETYTTVGSDDQQLSLVGNELRLTSDDGDDVVDLSGIAGTDAQTLSLTGDTLTISGSGSAVDLALADTIARLLDRIAALEAAVPRTVFVTSQAWNGDLGGIAGGDAKCQQLADDEGLDGTFRSWLSDAAGSPSSSFVQGARPFQLVDGTRIADDWADLTDGLLDFPILLDEKGGSVNADVWTNTDTAGDRAVADRDCDGWTNPSSSVTGRVGSSAAGDQFWTSFSFANCAQLRRLYCFN